MKADLLLAFSAIVLLTGIDVDAIVVQPVLSFGQAGPSSPPIQASDGNLYGTVPTDAHGLSAVYRVTTNGVFSIVYPMTNAEDGVRPSGLVEVGGGDLYGVAAQGLSQSITLFRVTTKGNFTRLNSYNSGYEGAEMNALVCANDGNLYGTSLFGGPGNAGIVFRFTTNGQLTTIYSFTNINEGVPSCLVHGDDGLLYGVTQGDTRIFRIDTNGTLSTLASLDGAWAWQPTALAWGYSSVYGITAIGKIFRVDTDGGVFSLGSVWQGLDDPKPSLSRGLDGSFYGTTTGDGVTNNGVVFRLTPAGQVMPLYSFVGTNDGAYPNGVVQATDGKLYGTTRSGGVNGWGTLFCLTTNGTLTTLHCFGTTSEPASIGGAGSLLAARDGNLYGTTVAFYSSGSVFRLGTDGTLAMLHWFSGRAEGIDPQGLVQASDGNLYGTTSDSWATNLGTVFRITTNGTVLTLHVFTGGDDGQGPCAYLAEGTDGSLYGTTHGGGEKNAGTVFRISTNGVLDTLYAFNGGADGANPRASLVQAADGKLYGTTTGGGNQTNGTVFSITADGRLTTLYTFAGGSDGGAPEGLVQAKDGMLYGATSSGGGRAGTLYRISTNGLLTTLCTLTNGPPPGYLIRANDGSIYGANSSGADNARGQVFCIKPDGTVSVFASAELDAGYSEYGLGYRLVQAADGNLYGTSL